MIIERTAGPMGTVEVLRGFLKHLARYELAKRILAPERPERVRARVTLHEYIDRHVRTLLLIIHNRTTQLEVLDRMITTWRARAEGADTSEDRKLTECARYYVDALQSVRLSLFGAVLPLEHGKE